MKTFLKTGVYIYIYIYRVNKRFKSTYVVHSPLYKLYIYIYIYVYIYIIYIQIRFLSRTYFVERSTQLIEEHQL